MGCDERPSVQATARRWLEMKEKEHTSGPLRRSVSNQRSSSQVCSTPRRPIFRRRWRRAVSFRRCANTTRRPWPKQANEPSGAARSNSARRRSSKRPPRPRSRPLSPPAAAEIEQESGQPVSAGSACQPPSCGAFDDEPEVVVREPSRNQLRPKGRSFVEVDVEHAEQPLSPFDGCPQAALPPGAEPSDSHGFSELWQR